VSRQDWLQSSPIFEQGHGTSHLGQSASLRQLASLRVIASPKLPAVGDHMTNRLAGLRTIGRQLASLEIAALRRLAIERRIASMAMLHRRRTSSPSVPGRLLAARPPAPRNPFNQEK